MHDTFQQRILNKLKIEKLNPMQEEAQAVISSNSEIILLSPTGTGKTLAFLLPVIAELNPDSTQIQALVIVPSRELAIQIEQIAREMGTGFKINEVYGGRAFSKEKLELKHLPAILIGTPGRIADHIRRETFSTHDIKTLILDEFDKSLEVGFEAEMSEIVMSLPNLRKKILTSATHDLSIPKFVNLYSPKYIDFRNQKINQLEVKLVVSACKDKRQTLVETLAHIGNEPGIIFCNFKETIQELSNYLTQKKINHACFYGGMKQIDRERALIKFRNGTHQLIIATDLAARGLDVPEMKFIIHFQLPNKEREFTHRNGRTARMNKSGTAFVLKWEQEILPEFVQDIKEEKLTVKSVEKTEEWKTLFISGGRKDKISKGDIAGLFFKQGNLKGDELGNIELKTDCAFVSVPSAKAQELINLLNNTKLKKKKVRIQLI